MPCASSSACSLAVPHAVYLTARGPFPQTSEQALLEAHGISIIVSKNSGGSAAYGKIAAARALSLPVIMLRRPRLAEVAAVDTVDAVERALDHLCALAAPRGV
jgi:precorrin-6A/cobalt-precorrin-6A reductase